MPKRRELSQEEQADARRLQAVWNRQKKAIGLTQEQVAADCGWSTQGAFSQYLLGRIPLNLRAVVKLARALHVEPHEISPRLAHDLAPTSPLRVAEESPRYGNPPEQNQKRNAWMRLFDEFERAGITGTAMRMLRPLASELRRTRTHGDIKAIRAKKTK